MDATATTSRLRKWLAGIDRPTLGLILLGLLVRAFHFGSVPWGLCQDEVSSAYDSFALLNYGIDRNGFHYPVVLVGWGSGMFALAAYVTMPFTAVLGLNEVSVRLPFLLAGLLGLFAFARLVRETDGLPMSRLATFLLAICPWHIMVSRWAMEVNLYPTVFLLGVLFAALSIQRVWLLPVSFFLLGMSLYAHGLAYVVVPTFLLLATPYAVYHRYWRPVPLVASSVLLGVLATPAVLYALINKFHWNSVVTPWFSIPRLPGVPRFETMGNFHVLPVRSFLANAAHNLLGAGRVLGLQYDGDAWEALPGAGLFYVFSAPLTLLGVVILVRRCWRREPTAAYFFLAWLMASLVLAALLLPSIHRLNIFVLPLVYATALGLNWLREHAPRGAFQGMVGVYIVAFLAFVAWYFVYFPQQTAGYYNSQLMEAIRSESQNRDDRVLVTGRNVMAYVYVLFATQEDPREFLRTVQYLNPGDEFQIVTSYGRFTFGPYRLEPDGSIKTIAPSEAFDAYVLRDELDSVDERVYKVEKFGQFTTLRPRQKAVP